MVNQSYRDQIIVDDLDDWKLFQGVISRRIMAFFYDVVMVLILAIPCSFAVFVAGILTFGLAWGFFAVLIPTIAIIYSALTVGGVKQATWGMQRMKIKMIRLDGQLIDPMMAIVHAVLFWAGNVLLSPFILIAVFIIGRKRTVHDYLLGLVMVRTDVQAKTIF